MAVSESRFAGLLKSAASVAGWVVVAVAALSGSSVAVAWLLKALFGGPISGVDDVLIGLALCLTAMLVAGYCHLRKETMQLRITDRDKFQRWMQIILQDLGYQLVTMTDRDWRTRPHFRAMLFGGGITVKLDDNRAAILGPRLSLELIRRRYRMASHLDKVQETIADSKSRIAETYLKRVELSLRLEPKHMGDFQARIVEALAANGQLLIDVDLMLISEDGMKESLWANEMRPWLEENGIFFEFRRDLTQRATIAATASDLHLDPCIDTCTWS